MGAAARVVWLFSHGVVLACGAGPASFAVLDGRDTNRVMREATVQSVVHLGELGRVLRCCVAAAGERR